MTARRVKDDEPIRPKRPRQPPATTPEAREQQLVGYAVDLAEEQLLAGTASSQVHSFYLKMASPREKLERERLAQENEMLKAKIDSMASAVRVEALYEDAISAMRAYGGHEAPAPIDDDEYYD